MKKSFFTLLLIFFVAGLNAQTTIAIIEFGADNVVSQAECKAIERAFRNGFDFNDYNVVDETLLNTTMRNNRISRASMSDDDLYKLSERLNFQQVLLGDISVLDDGYLSIDIRVLDFNEGPILEDGQKWLRGEGFGNPILDLLRRVREKLSKSTTDFTSANNENKYWAEVLRLERELGWQQSERGALDSEPEEERITLLETAPKGEYKRYTPKNTEKANEPAENAVTHSAQQPVKSKTPLENSEAFLSDIISGRGWTKSRNGLIYRIVKLGNTDQKIGNISDQVKVHYLGKTMRGELFDSSYNREEPVDVSLSEALLGWREALKLIGVGGKILVWLHPDMAYGERAVGNMIQPYDAIYFEIELLEINSIETQQTLATQPASEQALTATPSAEQTVGVSSSGGQQSATEPVSTNQVEVTTATESTAHVLEEVEYRTAYENTGNICYQAGDYATAFTNYVNAAKYGSIQSMSRLGQMYYKGMGVERNVQEAMKWWMLVVDNADAAEYNERKAVGFAANMIGYCYLAGRDGIAQNLDLAQRWAEKALGYGYRDAARLLNEIKKQKEIRGLP